MQARDAGLAAQRQRVVDVETARLGPAPRGDAAVAHVQGDEELLLERSREERESVVVLPDRRAHDDPRGPRIERGADGVE